MAKKKKRKAPAPAANTGQLSFDDTLAAQNEMRKSGINATPSPQEVAASTTGEQAAPLTPAVGNAGVEPAQVREPLAPHSPAQGEEAAPAPTTPKGKKAAAKKKAAKNPKQVTEDVLATAEHDPQQTGEAATENAGSAQNVPAFDAAAPKGTNGPALDDKQPLGVQATPANSPERAQDIPAAQHTADEPGVENAYIETATAAPPAEGATPSPAAPVKEPTPADSTTTAQQAAALATAAQEGASITQASPPKKKRKGKKNAAKKKETAKPPLPDDEHVIAGGEPSFETAPAVGTTSPEEAEAGNEAEQQAPAATAPLDEPHVEAMVEQEVAPLDEAEAENEAEQQAPAATAPLDEPHVEATAVQEVAPLDEAEAGNEAEQQAPTATTPLDEPHVEAMATQKVAPLDEAEAGNEAEQQTPAATAPLDEPHVEAMATQEITSPDEAEAGNEAEQQAPAATTPLDEPHVEAMVVQEVAPLDEAEAENEAEQQAPAATAPLDEPHVEAMVVQEDGPAEEASSTGALLDNDATSAAPSAQEETQKPGETDEEDATAKQAQEEADIDVPEEDIPAEPHAEETGKLEAEASDSPQGIPSVEKAPQEETDALPSTERALDGATAQGTPANELAGLGTAVSSSDASAQADPCATSTVEGDAKKAPADTRKHRSLFSNILLGVGTALIIYSLLTGGAVRIGRWLEGVFAGGDHSLNGGDVLNLEPVIYPTGVHFIADDRLLYEDGQMRLVIPSIGIDIYIKDGTDPQVLRQGAGLYEYSCMPSYGNPNVAIAGHRGVHGAEFYNIDKLEPDDLLYLYYGDYVYIYRYRETFIVDEDDWSLLECTQDSLLTLTSCDFDETRVRWIARCILVSVQAEDQVPAAALPFVPLPNGDDASSGQSVDSSLSSSIPDSSVSEHVDDSAAQ
ncbi:sortase [Ruminococcaceae bacterium OttesenSCG-928-N02]|nr:sortase [Ruminococcaceae bacterium OttesenSCG-928-N02]